MTEAPDPQAPGNVIVFSLGDDRFGVSTEFVEAIVPPPPLRRVPHATPALLGAGNMGGQILPILDLAKLVRNEASGMRLYDGRGDVIKLRTPQGGVGLWVDQVERLADGRADDTGELAIIDPIALLRDALTPPLLEKAENSISEAADALLDRHQPSSAAKASDGSASPPHTWVVVDVAGSELALPQGTVAELLETVRWTPYPRAPSGFLGVAVLHGNALPLLSLPGWKSGSIGALARVHVSGRYALVALDRIIGLRDGEPGEARIIDIAAALPDELHGMVLGFPPFVEATIDSETEAHDGSSFYLSFMLGGQGFALPVSCVERVVEAPVLVPLPRLPLDSGELGNTAGAIEIRGQIIPVAEVRKRLGLDGASAASQQSAAFAILRTNGGLGAVAIDQIGELVALSPAHILPPPPDAELLSGVATAAGREPLRLIAPALLWGEA